MALFCTTPVLASDNTIPVRGPSSLDTLTPHVDFRIERLYRLRSAQAGLQFTTPSETARFPHLRLVSATGCEVWLEDRNFDGRYDTELVTLKGQPIATCPRTDTAFAKSLIESGADTPEIATCLFHTTDRYDVACQPTRFGRPDGEVWTVLSGFSDKWGRVARGRPDSLTWNDGLIILDGEGGAIYRLSWDPKPDVEPEIVKEVEPDAPKAPRVLMGSGLKPRPVDDKAEPVSAEYQKILDDRERSFGQAGRSVTVGSE